MIDKITELIVTGLFVCFLISVGSCTAKGVLEVVSYDQCAAK